MFTVLYRPVLCSLNPQRPQLAARLRVCLLGYFDSLATVRASWTADTAWTLVRLLQQGFQHAKLADLIANSLTKKKAFIDSNLLSF